MNFVIIGTDHRFQGADPGLEELLCGFIKRFEPINAIAEEYSDDIGCSIGKRLAENARPKLLWYDLDMTIEEKQKADILQEQEWRLKCKPTCRVPSDEVRERAWVEKLTSNGTGTTLVICGYLHLESLINMLRGKECNICQRVYLESVPNMRLRVEKFCTI